MKNTTKTKFWIKRIGTGIGIALLPTPIAIPVFQYICTEDTAKVLITRIFKFADDTFDAFEKGDA